MSSNRNKSKMIQEEQRILDQLIKRMDSELIRLDKAYLIARRNHDRAKGRPLSDSYMDLIKSADDRIRINEDQTRLYQARSELYDTRIIVDIDDDQGREEMEMKIGLHTYLKPNEIFIFSWKMPVCRHYLLDNSAIDYHYAFRDKHGTICPADYHLKLKRKIKLFFDTVQDATQMFPVDEKEEEILADEFLKTLLERRTEKEFQNIVFSIQRKQGEIIGAPYKENMIVQGCAGSGKSMIMLHRLPILLFDNPNVLQRNRLYIITPSEAYIQMADNMRTELEISDLNMGTMNQYYNTILSRYNFKMDDMIGKIDYSAKVLPEQVDYIYSNNCLKDIHMYIADLIEAEATDFSYEKSILKGSRRKENYKTSRERVSTLFLNAEDLVNENHRTLRQYYDAINNCVHELFNFYTLLDNRKRKIIDSIRSSIYNEKETIEKKQIEITKYDPEKNAGAIENRNIAIRECRNRIADMNNELLEIDSLTADSYFEDVEVLKQELNMVVSKYAHTETVYSNAGLLDVYALIEDKQWLISVFDNIQKTAFEIDDFYTSYVDSIIVTIAGIQKTFRNMERIHRSFLSKDYMLRLINIRDYYKDLSVNLPVYVHDHILQKTGFDVDEKEKRCRPIEMSPYILCRILFDYTGVPNAAGESLITIDEAQNLAVNELQLLRDINKNVVFNLFGDVKQHIEGTKGVDDWNEFSGIVNFKKYYLEENYRNARQITDYCNKRFHLNMRAINVDGNGVHILEGIGKFRDTLQNLFHSADRTGLAAIIVKNQEEADSIKAANRDFDDRLNDITDPENMLSHNKWNLLTIKQAKGLEFNTVVAVSGRMTQNEKYICYTRALDELYIYDELTAINGIVHNSEDDGKIKETRKEKKKKNIIVDESGNRKKSIQYGNEVEKFFLDKGLEVVNTRKKDGYIRVIGDEEHIGEYVNEAIRLFGISGQYGKSKATKLREAWATKTRK